VPVESVLFPEPNPKPPSRRGPATSLVGAVGWELHAAAEMSRAVAGRTKRKRIMGGTLSNEVRFRAKRALSYIYRNHTLNTTCAVQPRIATSPVHPLAATFGAFLRFYQALNVSTHSPGPTREPLPC
jgi:hypothetical protein